MAKNPTRIGKKAEPRRVLSSDSRGHYRSLFPPLGTGDAGVLRRQKQACKIFAVRLPPDRQKRGATMNAPLMGGKKTSEFLRRTPKKKNTTNLVGGTERIKSSGWSYYGAGRKNHGFVVEVGRWSVFSHIRTAF